jgi:hypothetical protein
VPSLSTESTWKSAGYKYNNQTSQPPPSIDSTLKFLEKKRWKSLKNKIMEPLIPFSPRTAAENPLEKNTETSHPTLPVSAPEKTWRKNKGTPQPLSQDSTGKSQKKIIEPLRCLLRQTALGNP